jgi:hypothetical protein
MTTSSCGSTSLTGCCCLGRAFGRVGWMRSLTGLGILGVVCGRNSETFKCYIRGSVGLSCSYMCPSGCTRQCAAPHVPRSCRTTTVPHHTKDNQIPAWEVISASLRTGAESFNRLFSHDLHVYSRPYPRREFHTGLKRTPGKTLFSTMLTWDSSVPSKGEDKQLDVAEVSHPTRSISPPRKAKNR